MPDFPEYFLVRVQTDEGWQLVTCQAISSINEDKLPGSMRETARGEFGRRLKPELMEVIGLPPLDDGLGWVAMQSSLPIGRPKPPKPGG